MQWFESEERGTQILFNEFLSENPPFCFFIWGGGYVFYNANLLSLYGLRCKYDWRNIRSERYFTGQRWRKFWYYGQIVSFLVSGLLDLFILEVDLPLNHIFQNWRWYSWFLNHLNLLYKLINVEVMISYD